MLSPSVRPLSSRSVQPLKALLAEGRREEGALPLPVPVPWLPVPEMAPGRLLPTPEKVPGSLLPAVGEDIVASAASAHRLLICSRSMPRPLTPGKLRKFSDPGVGRRPDGVAAMWPRCHASPLRPIAPAA